VQVPGQHLSGADERFIGKAAGGRPVNYLRRHGAGVDRQANRDDRVPFVAGDRLANARGQRLLTAHHGGADRQQYVLRRDVYAAEVAHVL
jgi:hypothetical protein